MILAEALAERSDCQTRLNSLVSRIRQNSLIQEGTKPAEDPNELLKEYTTISKRCEKLVIAINYANQAVSLPDGTILATALAHREYLKQRHSMLTNVAEAATPTLNRYSNTELKSIPTLDVSALRKEADEVAKAYRQLDSVIQQINWTTNIIIE